MLPTNEILNKIVNSYKDILKDNLVGIYLHGSLAMNCFNPNSSDIDFLVVIKEKLDFKDMRQLIDVLLQLSELGPKKGFEMSVLLEQDTKNFKYPTHFVLHFSDFHKDRYINQPNYICGGFEDHDLAAHIVILRERGICLHGSPIKDVFQEVPKKYYIDAIKSDIEDSKTEIKNNPVYYILNLCRVLYFLQDGNICSKKEGGEWAIINIPEKFKDIIQGALNIYSDTNNVFSVNSKNLVEFADYMLSEIENLHDKEGL